MSICLVTLFLHLLRERSAEITLISPILQETGVERPHQNAMSLLARSIQWFVHALYQSIFPFRPLKCMFSCSSQTWFRRSYYRRTL